MSELKKCPFCGGEAIMRERYINGIANTKHYQRECRRCKATFANWYRSMKKADEAWNRRAQPDNSRQRALQTGVCPMCEDCPDGCPVEAPNDSRNKPENEPLNAPKTNADRIRGMSDEELAEWIDNVPKTCKCHDHCEMCLSEKDCETPILAWLQQPAETEGTE